MNQPSLWERLAERQQSPTRPASGTKDVAPSAPDVAAPRPRDASSSGPHDVASTRPDDAATSRPRDAVSSRLIGRRYRLADRIGRGKFGPIYAATDEGRRDLGIEP